MHRLKTYAKKYGPDIILTLAATIFAALLVLAFILTVPRHIDKLEAKTAERQATLDKIYSGD